MVFLVRLGLDHLVGTPAVKPYMHGYFLSLKLYETARVIANPFAYDEYREKMVRDKMEKMSETRIRAKKDGGVKVNKTLAAKILREEERKSKKAERKDQQKELARSKDNDQTTQMLHEDSPQNATKNSHNLLSDPRFAKIFEDRAYTIDETSREYALLNPSSVPHRDSHVQEGNNQNLSDDLNEDSDNSVESHDDESTDEGSDSSKEGGEHPNPFGE